MNLWISLLAFLAISIASNPPNYFAALKSIERGDLDDFRTQLTKPLIRQYGLHFMKLACEKGSFEMTKHLMTMGVLPIDAQPFLEIAVNSGNRDLVSLLVEIGADLNWLEWETVANVALRGDVGMMAYIIEHGYRFDDEAYQIFDSAVISESLEMINYLVGLNAEIVHIDIDTRFYLCQKAVLMGRMDIFEILLSKQSTNSLRSLLGIAVVKRSQLMTKHLTHYITNSSFSFHGSVWSDIVVDSIENGRKDVAESVLLSLSAVDLAKCLEKLFETPRRFWDEYMAIAVKATNIAGAVADSAAVAQNLYAYSFNAYPDIVKLVFKHASPEGLSKCLSLIRVYKNFDDLEQLMQQSNCVAAFLHDPSEIFHCFTATRNDRTNAIAEDILKIIDGTAYSAELFCRLHEQDNPIDLFFFLNHSPNIHRALECSPASADKLYSLAHQNGDEELKHLCTFAITGDLVLASIHHRFTESDGEFDEIEKECRNFLKEVSDEAVQRALEKEKSYCNPDSEIMEILLQRLADPKSPVHS